MTLVVLVFFALLVTGVPVGRLLAGDSAPEKQAGSIMIILATDAPATARQLDRLARRAVAGLARTGSIIGHGSGDFVIAFSTAQRFPRDERALTRDVRAFNEAQIAGHLFRGVVESTEEAILNALFTARTLPGIGRARYPELPVEDSLAYLRAAGRLV